MARFGLITREQQFEILTDFSEVALVFDRYSTPLADNCTIAFPISFSATPQF